MPTFKLFVVSLVLSCCAVGMANAQTFQFAKKLGCDKAEDRGAAIAVDQQGNIYSTGYFRSWNGIGALAADFDPGPAFYPLWSNQGGTEAFISKLNSQGNFVWAKQFDGTGYSIGKAIANDALGNVYVSGEFVGEVDFNPGSGVFNLTSNGAPPNLDVFIVKLSSSGSFIWAKSIGGILNESNSSLAIDKSGFVYVSGGFTVEADFDPGPNIFLLNAQVYSNGYLTKLDENGNFVWAKNMGGEGGRFVIDITGNIIYNNAFDGTTDLNPHPNQAFNLATSGFSDVSITRLNPNGNFEWAKSIGSKGFDYANEIIADSAGNIFITGGFSGDSLIDGQTDSLLALNSKVNGRNEAFILKFDNTGQIRWCHAVGDTADDEGITLALERKGSVYIAGIFRDSVDFDPGPGTHYIRAIGDPDAFILKLDSAGKFERALAIGGLSYTRIQSLFIDSLRNLFATGWYTSGLINGTVDFDPGSNVFQMNGTTAGGNDDIFVLKLRSCQTDTATETVSACRSYVWQNNTYTQSGSYAKTLSTANGCDSTILLKLTIRQPVLAGASYNLCPSETVAVGSKIYSQPGIYLDTLIAANGCDSLITSTLAYSYPNDTLVANGPQLEAAAGQDSYQWLDCNAGFVPIQGETSSGFAPAVSGSYAVRVTKGNCSDTSDCVVFTSVAKSVNREILVYPQPAHDLVYIRHFEDEPIVSICVFDAIGRRVLAKKSDGINSFSVSRFPAGWYSIVCTTPLGSYAQKLLIKPN